MTIPYTDTFTTGTTQALGTYNAGWVVYNGSWEANVAGQARATTASANNDARWTTDAPNADQRVSILLTVNTFNDYIGITLRDDGAGNRYQIETGPGGDSYISRIIGGSIDGSFDNWTQSPAWATGNWMRAEAEGTGATVTIRVYRSTDSTDGSDGTWTLVRTWNDTTANRITAANRVGIHAYGNVPVYINTFRLDNLAAGPTYAELAGQSSAAFTNSGNLTLRANLAGQSSVAFSNVGALAMAAALAGQSSVAFAPTADLTLLSQGLQGQVSVAFSNAGALSLTANLGGQSTQAFLNSASLSLNVKMDGLVPLAFTNTGSLSVGTNTDLAGQSSVAFTPAADLSNWPHVTLTSVHSPASERLTSTPDLAVGDQIEWGNIQGTGAVVVNPDGTFEADSTVGAFSFRVWDSSDRTFGAVALQDLTGTTYTELAGQVALTFTPSAALGYYISIAGAVPLTFANTGALGYYISVAGQSSVTFAPAGALTLGQALAGQSSVAFTNSGNLELLSGSDLAGGINLRFSNSGTLQTVGVTELAGQVDITLDAVAYLLGALDVTPGDTFFAPFETAPTSVEARLVGSFGVPAGYSATITPAITPEAYMTIRVGESGKAFRYFTAYDMSAYSALALRFVRPDGTSFTRTNPSVYLGGGVVDPQLGSLPAQQYLEYLIQDTDFPEAGDYTVTGQFTNLVPDPDTILIGPTVTFTVEAGMPA